MSRILTLRGAAAFSASRLARLETNLLGVVPKLRGLAAEQCYFIELTDALLDDERARLVELLGATPASATPPAGEAVLVVPRLGTISPWSG